MAGVTEEYNFKFYVILISVNLSKYMRLVADTLDSTVLWSILPHSLVQNLQITFSHRTWNKTHIP